MKTLTGGCHPDLLQGQVWNLFIMEKPKWHSWWGSLYWTPCTWCTSDLVSASWLPPRCESGNKFQCCECLDLKRWGLCMVEYSNRGSKGPVGKPMAVYFLAQAVTTVASFTYFFRIHWFFCTQAQRFHGSWQLTRFWGRKKDHMCVMKRLKALPNQPCFLFLVQAVVYRHSFPARSKTKPSWLWSSKK